MIFGNLDDLPIPEEMKDAIRSTMEQNNMSAEAFKHDVQRLLEEADKDHLLTMRHLFAIMSTAEDGRYAAYLEGCAAATLSQKYSVCSSCGKNHDEEFLSAAQPAGDGVQPSMFESEQQSISEIATWAELCERYGVLDIGPPLDSDTQSDIIEHKVQCKHCGQVYVNLADRMIKPPGKEGCEGCIHKEKWG